MWTGFKRPAVKRAGDENGASAVELALVAPILIMLVFGMIQFGFYFSQGAGLATGARSAARIGSVNLVTQTSCSDVIQAARDQTTGLGLPMSAVRVTVSRGATEAAATTICSRTGSSAVTPSSATTTFPCTLPSTATRNETLYVVSEYATAGVGIPMVGKWTMPLSATGAYRCEYR